MSIPIKWILACAVVMELVIPLNILSIADATLDILELIALFVTMDTTELVSTNSKLKLNSM